VSREHGEGIRHSASLSTTPTTPSPSTLYVCFGFVSPESFSHHGVVVYSIDSVPNRPAHTHPAGLEFDTILFP
jgi:hypothetical protein